MANTIALRKAYATMLDEVYKLASLTAVLDGPNELVKEGANANEILIPKMTMSGLANYNKQTGYVAGDVTLEYETKKCTYDRGRMFTVDAMDNIESAGVAFGRLSGEFLRTQVVPELDAWRLSSYAGYAPSTNKVGGGVMLTNTGITIFNAFSDKKSKKIVYVPHYIDAVWFHADQKTEIVNGGLNSADAYKIRIPYEKCENWISASEFRKSSGVSGKWTVQNGDFFMIGRWTGENVSGIDEIRKNAVGIVGKVLNHSENFFGGSKHIRIGGGS